MDFNQSPYFDDYDELKKFYKIMFRPGVAVQTRELNQLQSILQNQVTKFGDHMFKEGSMVIPGQVLYTDKLNFIKLSSASLGSLTLADLKGLELSTGTLGTGVKATVITAIAAVDNDPDTLIIQYTGADQGLEGSGASAFAAGQTLYITENQSLSLVVQTGVNATGRSAAANIQNGIYYLNGYFVNVTEQDLVIEKYVGSIANISYRAGLQYVESIVTEETDSSLYDNANNTTNFTAPGAHRYKIEVNFVRAGLDEDPENFFELLRIENGVVQKLINFSQYNILEETLARRTFDESGNYTVEDFKIDIREHRSNNRQTWASQTNYQVGDYISYEGRYFECVRAGQSAINEPNNFATADQTAVVVDGTVYWRYSENPSSNLGRFLVEEGGISSNLVYIVSDGKAYVAGHEVFRDQVSNIVVAKSRTSSNAITRTFPVNNGNFIILDRNATWGMPDVTTGPRINLYDRQLGDSSYAIKFGYGRPVGTARVKFMDSDFSGGIKLGLFEVKMEPGRLLDQDVNMVAMIDSSSATTSKSYLLSGTFRYTGGSATSVPMTASILRLPQLTDNTTIGTITSVATIFTRELTSGDTINITNTSATVSSFAVVGVNNDTTILVRYLGAGTAATSLLTSVSVLLPAFTIAGIGSSAALCHELRAGDRVFLSSASVYVSGTVTQIYSFPDTGDNRNRLTISSVTTTAVSLSGAGVSAYAFYEGQGASFLGNILGQYNVGVNATKLTGQFSLKDVDGNNTIDPAPHQAVRIVAAGSDARLLTEQLFENDLIDINGNKIFVTRRSDNLKVFGICLDRQIATTDATFPAFVITNKVYDTADSTFLYRVDETPASITDNTYRVYKTETQFIATETSIVSVSLSTGGNPVEVAWTNNPADYLISRVDTTAVSTQYTILSVVPTASNIVLTLNTSVSGTIRIIYNVDRVATAGTLAGLKTKTLTYDQSFEILNSSSAQLNRLVLPHADVLRVNKVLMARSFVSSWTTAVATTALDVTRNWNLDDGQRDAYYDYSALELSNTAPVASGSLKIYYDFFDHGAGDFFAFGSYNSAQIAYENIPDYKAQKLRDHLDFRPLYGTTSTLVNVNILRYGSSFQADTTRYLARKDKLVLDRNSNIYTLSSIPGVSPEVPRIANSNNTENIELFDVSLESYTDSASWPEVQFTAKDNRRYTMRDIGRLEKRIENLEEVATLSLLEVSTKSLQIRDNNDPTLERYKTGFFVDPFTDQTNADNVIDNRFTINTDAQTMQAHISNYGLPLVEKINFTGYSSAGNQGEGETQPIDAARAIQNYRVTGDCITLPYTTSVVLKQTMATTSIAVAPYIAISFIGTMKVFPSKDIYEDVTTIKININDPKNKERRKEAEEIGERLYGSNYVIDTTTTKKVTTTEIDRTLIPYCRPNTLSVVISGLRPNSKFYPLIDGVDIRRYVTGAVRQTMTSIGALRYLQIRPNGKKDWARWRSLAYSFTERKKVKRGGVKIGGKRYKFTRITKRPKDYDQFLPSSKYGDAFRKAFENGASIYYNEGSRNRGSGVAMHQDDNTLYIVNGRGRLSPDYIRTRPNSTYIFDGRFNIAGLTGYFTTLPVFLRTASQVCSDDTDGNLYSDSKGNLVFTIDFPQDDNLSFFTGKKSIVVSDTPNDDTDNTLSRAEATYEVQGEKVVVTKTTVTTKTYKAKFNPPPQPPDPIAQSFRIPDGYPDGLFLSGADFYFQQTMDTDDKPLFFEIRVCDPTSRPSPEIVPGSQVIKYASEVNVDSSRGTVATTFVFQQPIHLKAGIEYAMVMKTDSIKHKVWIATLGQPDVATTSQSYGAQATLGSFFKSQNNTLWTEDQLSDLKFQLHRCVFNTSVTGVVHVTNQNIATQSLPGNPFTFMQGSAKIRVSHPNHGYRNGDLVRFHSKSYADIYAVSSGATLAGIPLTQIFGTSISEEQVADTDPVLTVESCNIDDYVITASTLADLGTDAVTAETLRVEGGTDVFANTQVLYHVLTPQLDTIGFQNTTLNLRGYLIEGHTYDNLPATGYSQYSDALDINVTNVENSRPKVILSDLNEERRYSGTTITAGSGTETWYDSFIGRIQMTSESNHVSPVLDMSSCFLNVIQHRIDNPTRTSRLGGGTLPQYGTTSVFIVYQTIVSSNTSISFNAAQSSIVATAADTFTGIVPGRYITVTGAANAQNINTSTGILVTGISADRRQIFVDKALIQESAGSSVTIRQLQDFTEEATLTDATGESKYITRKINLENPATQVKILIDLNVPDEADFDIYYKLGSAAEDFNDFVWTIFADKPTVNKDNNRKNFTEYECNITDFDVAGKPLDKADFTAFQFKFVMRSTNAARIPAFRNLRVIAHA